MTAAARRRAGAVLLALAPSVTAGACTRLRHEPPPRVAVSPSSLAAGDWPAARDSARQAILRRDFARADSQLRAFAARYPGTDAAAETGYWRALLRLDPAAEGLVSRDQVREARAELDAYIAGGPRRSSFAEATVLRRLAGHLDSLHSTADAVRAMIGTPASRDSARARDEELARLRAELDQTKAELDRIRRRVSPRP